MQYWSNGTYSAIIGLYPFCNVNVEDTDLYVFMLKFFDSDIVPLGASWSFCAKMYLIVEMLT